jgi:hypothetical protein
MSPVRSVTYLAPVDLAPRSRAPLARPVIVVPTLLARAEVVGGGRHRDGEAQRGLGADAADVMHGARGTHTMSSLRASTTTSPVSSQRSSPAITTHHSSKSACQWGRLPPPGALAISVTSWRSSWMIRRDHGGGPMRPTTSAMRVRSALGPSTVAASGGVGPVARCAMLIVVISNRSAIDRSPPRRRPRSVLPSRGARDTRPGAAPCDGGRTPRRPCTARRR